MLILGISAFYHDSAAALVRDGDVVAAAQEERFTRKKHDAGFPANAIRWCLADAKSAQEKIDYVVFYDKPFLKFERLLETYVAFVPRGFTSFCKALPVWMAEKLFQKNMLRRELDDIDEGLGDPDKLLFTEHHYSHAASPSIHHRSMRRRCLLWTALASGRRPRPGSAAATPSS